MNIYESFLQSRSTALTTGHDSSICSLANSSNCFVVVVVLFETKGRKRKSHSRLVLIKVCGAFWLVFVVIVGLGVFLSSAGAWRLSSQA